MNHNKKIKEFLQYATAYWDLMPIRRAEEPGLINAELADLLSDQDLWPEAIKVMKGACYDTGHDYEASAIAEHWRTSLEDIWPDEQDEISNQTNGDR